jgi:tetratricopeptide (TPR) repeat protein/tRNA A-37 threonylcarbamoyl transferase component Bud32
MANNSTANYTITKLLGRGGMAEVYEAVDTKDQKNVALKLLLPHLAAEDIIRQRFLREARVGMELDHPGIVKVFDVGEAEGRPYMAMELVKGKTLDTLLKTKTFDLEQCIGIALKITDALAAAHQQKIVHRDIKPRNIMVTDAGIKIMDFGLARILETSSITDQHEIIGTLYYMSPEQAIGIKVDESSDVFSLGVVLYQMLTGQLPFAGEHPGAIIHAILYSDPLRIDELGKTIPLELEQVIFKTLKKKPQARYRTASELHTDLSKMHYVLQGQPIQLLATEEVFEESPRGIYSQLVGREKDMARLEAALEKMMQGESSVILVSGEAGIGKSRLVWELGQKAKAKQARYLLGRCLFGERGYPYQPVIDVLRDYFKLKGIKDPDAVDAFIEEKAKHLSARRDIIQSLLRFQTCAPLSLINKEQLWDTVSELIKLMVQDRPVVLHLDDLHWADAPTLNLLTYLAMTSRNDRLIIMGTYRPEELAVTDGKQHPLEATRQLLSKENLFHELRLARLNKQGTHDVVNSVFADSDFPENFYDSVHLETEGNPLFVLEVLNYLQNEGIVDRDETGWHLVGELTKLAIPDRVTDVITHRLKTLTPENRSLLDVAAVEGYSFQSDTLCHVLGEPRLKVLRRLQHLESQHHLVHALEHEYQFDHGKIQETIYNTLTPELKREYHKQMADYFIKCHANNDEFAGKIANHLIKANLADRALPFLLRAGHYAQQLYANQEAIDYFDSGISLVNEMQTKGFDTSYFSTHLALLEGRAGVNRLVGNYDKTLADYKTMASMAIQVKAQKYLATALDGLGQIHNVKAEYARALDFYNQALSIQTGLANVVGEAHVLHGIGDVNLNIGKHHDALVYYEQALEKYKDSGNKNGEAWVCFSIGRVHWNLGEFAANKKYLNRALQIFREEGDRHGEAVVLQHTGTYYYSAGLLNDGLQFVEPALTINRDIGNKHGEFHSLWLAGKFYNNLGYYDKSLAYYQQALQIGKQIWIQEQDYVLIGIGEIHTARGDFEQALDYFDQAIKFEDQVLHLTYRAYALCNIGHVHLKLANYVSAIKHFKQAYQSALEAQTKWVISFYHGYLHILWSTLNACDEATANLQGLKRMEKTMGALRAQVFIKIGELRQKMIYCSKAKETSLADDAVGLMQFVKEKTPDAFLLSQAYAASTQALLDAKELRRAKIFAKEFRDYAVEKTHRPDSALAHLLLSRIEFLQNKYSQSASYARSAIEYADRCRVKEILWQAHHMLAKVYLKQKKMKQAKDEIVKAKEVLDVIINNLGDELKKIYLKRKEVKEFKEDLRSIKRKSPRRRGK